LTAAIPIICIMIETIWLRQSIPLQRSLGIVLSILGVYLVIGQAPSIGSGGRIAGDLLILAAALCWAIYSILGRNLNQYSKLTVVTYQTIYGTLMLFPFAASEYSQWHGLSLATCLNILYLGLMCSAATYLLYNYALKTLTASQVSTYLNLIPLIGVVTAMFLLGESIQFIQILGGGVILAGVAISTPT